jgi:colanic acid/amylovoran biosynthesis glycosyltransferase
VRVAYVTSRFPYGPGEAFLGPELRAVAERVESLLVVPMSPHGGLVHADAGALVSQADRTPVVSATVLRAALRGSVSQPRRTAAALGLVARSRSARIAAKNAAVLPKAIWLSRLLRERRIDHLHVHWGGASSTMAMIAATRAGVPWSLTLHRWDIAEDNLLAAKIEAAAFTRVISRRSLADVLARVPGADLDVIHMGVELAPLPPRNPSNGAFRLVAVGGLVPVKGHAILLETLRAALARNPTRSIALEIVGDGPLRAELAELVQRLDLGDHVRFLGLVPHDSLLAGMRGGRWDAIVHASIDQGDLHEGIPVALMEAMSARLPVIATASGGVPELVGAAGSLVPPGDVAALAAAIGTLASSPGLVEQFAAAGYARVRDDFDAAALAGALVERFAGPRRVAERLAA